MSYLADSPFDDEHPFSMYVGNLRASSSLTWFSATASINQLRDYVWGLMDLRPENTRHTEEGFAQTSAATVLFIGVSNLQGVALTCFPMDDLGVSRINGALDREFEITAAELSQGAYRGNAADAWSSVIDHGSIHPDYEGSVVFDYINGGTVMRLDS